MRTLYKALLLLTVSSLACFVNAGSEITKDRYLLPAMTSIDIEKKPADMITIEDILNWKQPYVLKLEEPIYFIPPNVPEKTSTITFYAIDLENKTAKTLACPRKLNLIGFAAQPGGKSFALCSDGRHTSLLTVKNNTWVKLELPHAIRKTQSIITLADAENFVLLTEKSIYTYSGNEWRRIGYKQTGEEECGQKYTLYQGKIFIAFSCGAEWESGLFSVDISTGKRQKYDYGRVSGFAVDKTGNLWASSGWRLWDKISGEIVRFDGKTWTEFASVSGSGEQVFAKYEFSNVKSVNWPYIPVLFYSLGFGDDDALYTIAHFWYTNYGVLEGDGWDSEHNYMLLKYHNGKWKNLGIVGEVDDGTPSATFHFKINSFNIQNDRAIIAFTGYTKSKVVILDLNNP
jgi:hypothetical protein